MACSLLPPHPTGVPVPHGWHRERRMGKGGRSCGGIGRQPSQTFPGGIPQGPGGVGGPARLLSTSVSRCSRSPLAWGWGWFVGAQKFAAPAHLRGGPGRLAVPMGQPAGRGLGLHDTVHGGVLGVWTDFRADLVIFFFIEIKHVQTLFMHTILFCPRCPPSRHPGSDNPLLF